MGTRLRFNVGLFHQYGVTGAKCTWNYNRETGQVEQPDNPFEYPQGSACFIQSVDDNMEDIMRLASSEAMLPKFASGTGTDLSTIRSSRENKWNEVKKAHALIRDAKELLTKMAECAWHCGDPGQRFLVA